MDRRDFLTAKPNHKEKSQTSQPVASRHITSGLNPYAGPWTENEIIHLLKRTMFGAKKADVDYFKTRTVDQAVNELVNPVAPQPSPPIKEYATSTTATTPDGNITQGAAIFFDGLRFEQVQLLAGRRQNPHTTR